MDLDQEDIEDLEDSPESELEEQEEKVLDQATAAQTIGELRSEINTIKGLESAANDVLQSGGDTKWRELANLLGEIFTPQEAAARIAEDSAPYGSEDIPGLYPHPSRSWSSSPNTGTP